MDLDIVQQHAPRGGSRAVAHRQRNIWLLGQQQRHVRKHLRVGEQHRIRSGHVLAIDEQPAVVAPLDSGDGARQTLFVVDDVEAFSRRAQVGPLQLGVKRLAVR